MNTEIARAKYTEMVVKEAASAYYSAIQALQSARRRMVILEEHSKKYPEVKEVVFDINGLEALANDLHNEAFRLNVFSKKCTYKVTALEENEKGNEVISL